MAREAVKKEQHLVKAADYLIRQYTNDTEFKMMRKWLEILYSLL